MTLQTFQPGDLVVLTRGGTNQPAAQLMAIWTIEQLHPTHAIVIFDPKIQIVELEGLGRKRYSLDWLALYKRR